jgi:hypothetical protein
MPGSWPNIVVKEPRPEDATFCDGLWACLLNDYDAYDAEDDNSTVYSTLSDAHIDTTKEKSKSRAVKNQKRRPKDGVVEKDFDEGEESRDHAKNSREEPPSDPSTHEKAPEDAESLDAPHDRQIPSAPSHEDAPPSPPVKKQKPSDPEDTNEIQRMRKESTNREPPSDPIDSERELPVERSRKRLALEKEKSQRSMRPSRSSGAPEKEISHRSKRTPGTGAPREKEKSQRHARASRTTTHDKNKGVKSTRAITTIDPSANEKSAISMRENRPAAAPLEKEKSQRSVGDSRTVPTDAPVASSAQFASIEEYQQSVLDSRRRAERKVALKRIREIKAKLSTKEDP